MNNEFVKVTKEELLNFVKNYGSELHENTCGFFTPPFTTFNDFTKGKWPDSVVAEIVLNEALEGYSFYKGEPNDYFILTPIHEDKDTKLNDW